jgi:hypothetical protein
MLKNVCLSLISALIGAAIAYILTNDVDFLMEQVETPVVLSTDITLTGEYGESLSLPVGTHLFLEGTYQDEAYLALRIVTTRPNIFDEAEGDQVGTYYLD